MQQVIYLRIEVERLLVVVSDGTRFHVTSPPDNPRQLAQRLLRSGTKVPEVERALIQSGMDPAAASVVVDDALKRGLAAASEGKRERSFSWVRVVVGLGLATVAFVGIYIALANKPDGVFAGAGAWRGGVRGAILGAGGGLAIGALNAVRAELMLLIDPDD